MISEEILAFRDRLAADPENRKIRISLHENYELLESYWQRKFKGNNGEQIFCDRHQEFYWKFEEIRAIAKEFAQLAPVGNSKSNFQPTENILKATYHLKYDAELFEEGQIIVSQEERCNANLWNQGRTSFKAVFEIVKQIRNNLFHGRKIELDNLQYHRNQSLIELANRFTNLLLVELVNAEVALNQKL